MKNYLGQAGSLAGKYSELAWKYLFDKGYWVYIAVGIAAVFLIIFAKAPLKNPVLP